MRLLAVDAADKAEAGQIGLVLLRTIGGVGPVQQILAQACALIGRGIGDLPASDQAEAAIDGDVVLIAEARNGNQQSR